VRFALFAWVLLALSIPGRADAQGTWTGTDIGQVAVAGTATVSGSRITINAEGTDIWNTADSCYFVYRTLAADGQVTARVSSLTAVTGWTKGGLMIRQSLSSNSMMAALLATPSNGVAFEQRPSTGAAAVNTPVAGLVAPVWLRLSRSGTVVTAYRSMNGTSWVYLARADIGFSGTVYVGFAVSSNGASQLATGTFDSTALATTVSTAPPAGPVAAYAFDEGTGTTARDSAGTNHATLNRATWTTSGHASRGLALNGVDQNASVPDAAALDLTTAGTIEAWVRPTTVVGQRSLLTKESPTGLSYQVQPVGSGGRPSAAFNTGSGDLRMNAGSALALNTWSHVAVTLSGTIARLYVNGAQVASRTVSGTLAQTSGVLRIGGAATFGDWFAGTVDDLRIYNRALSQLEIVTDRNNPVASSGGGGSDSTAPTIAVTSPTSGANVSGTVALAATASDNVAVTNVQFRVNGANVGAPDTVAPYGASWNTTGLASGSYAITAIASDAAGNATTSAAINVTIGDASAPTVSGTVALAASASDNVGVASVQFRVNGTNVGAADTTSPYAASWATTGLAAGTYTITAVATDAAGNQATSAGVNVTIAGSVVINARSVAFDSPSHNATGTGGQAIVTSYQLEIWAAGSSTTGTPLHTSDMGKPVSSTTALTIDRTAFFSGLPRNQQFIATVSAIGPGGSSRSDASNTFTMQ
jgi:hypothetical protein